MAVKIFPAIDLYDGKVVRLTQGDYSRLRGYDISPSDAAKRFLDAGCRQIHIVDLEGAKAGKPRNISVLSEIAALGLFVQYGGGLRDADAVGAALDAGAGRVMAGSLIFNNIDKAAELSARFGERIMAAVDVRNGKIVHSGWLKETELSAAEAVEKLSAMGFSAFLVTRTEFDGMMNGTDAAWYAGLVAPGRFIAAAGGVTSLSDIRALSAAGVSAAVIGKSLYEGGITIEEAMAACSEKIQQRG